MTNRPLPWGINTIGSPYHPDVHAGLPDGRWVHAVCEPHDMGRLRAAWWVLTGRAYAFLWPYAGELEGIFQRLNPPEIRPSPRPFTPQADSKVAVDLTERAKRCTYGNPDCPKCNPLPNGEQGGAA